MSDTVPTMKVKPWSADQGDHVLINVADFDPAKHAGSSSRPTPPTSRAAGKKADAADKPADTTEG
jgi:hypothetical protein